LPPHRVASTPGDEAACEASGAHRCGALGRIGPRRRGERSRVQ
jgi:hypothetical protein